MFSGKTVLSALLAFASATLCLAQDEQPSLGDVARQERARKAAARAAAGPELGNSPPLVIEGEIVPAHFLRIDGGFGTGEYSISLNGRVLLRNSHVAGLPLYISGHMREGGNLIELQFVSHPARPLDVTIEERFPGEAEHRQLAKFHSDPNQFTAATHQKVPFTAHPRAIPDVRISDADQAEIRKLVQSFYDALSSRNGQSVLKLFEPALRDARQVYPEGADFGASALERLAHVVVLPGFSMNTYDPNGLIFRSSGNVVTVSRAGDVPVFVSNEVTAGVDGSMGASRVNADVIPVKKIDGVWRLTLPFGF